jgi:predicted ATPase
MGKTSLLQRFAVELAERGARAIWGTCWEGDQAPALWPWTQVVRTLLDQDRDEDVVTAELAVVVPERAQVVAASASGPGDEAGRLRVFDAVGRLLDRASSRRPTVVLLDDLQWSDRSTVDLMRFLVGMAPAADRRRGVPAGQATMRRGRRAGGTEGDRPAGAAAGVEPGGGG